MLTLTITLNDDGQLNCSGPLANKLQCFGMLELAKEAIADFHKAQAAAATQRVQSATNEEVAALVKL